MDQIEQALRVALQQRGEMVLTPIRMRMITRGILTAYYIVQTEDMRVDVMRVELRRLDPSQNGHPPGGVLP